MDMIQKDFENALNTLQVCKDKMDNGIFQRLSKPEQDMWAKIVDLCSEIVDDYTAS